MINRYLDNYKSFNCIADKCPDTCCSGWMIEIDDSSLEKYGTYQRTHSQLFDKKIDWSLNTFIRQENGDCSFLRSDGLCQLQRTLGEEALCITCDKYPRHTEEFPQVREHSLSISCPAVAENFVLSENLLSFLEESNSDADLEEYEDFNQTLYKKLEEIRSTVFNFLANKDLSFEEKAARIHIVMVDIQEHLDFGQWDNCDESVSELLSTNADTGVSTDQLFNIFHSLEPLRDSFVNWTKEIAAMPSISDTILLSQMREELPWLDLLKNNLCYYFLYTYFCGAVYDDYVYAQGQQAIFNTQMIELLLFGRWLENKKSLSQKEASEIIYKYSRELEHSNDNLIALTQLLDEEQTFQ